MIIEKCQTCCESTTVFNSNCQIIISENAAIFMHLFILLKISCSNRETNGGGNGCEVGIPKDNVLRLTDYRMNFGNREQMPSFFLSFYLFIFCLFVIFFRLLLYLKSKEIISQPKGGFVLLLFCPQFSFYLQNCHCVFFF